MTTALPDLGELVDLEVLLFEALPCTDPAHEGEGDAVWRCRLVPCGCTVLQCDRCRQNDLVWLAAKYAQYGIGGRIRLYCELCSTHLFTTTDRIFRWTPL